MSYVQGSSTSGPYAAYELIALSEVVLHNYTQISARHSWFPS